MKKLTGLITSIGLLTLLTVSTFFVVLVSATTYKTDVDQDYGFYRVISTDKNQSVSYINKTLNISVGDTIIWINDATPDWPLTIISNQGLWGDRDAYLRWNYQKFSYIFNKSGTYSISLKECKRCQNQTIIVNSIETPTPTTTLIEPTVVVINAPVLTPTIAPTETRTNVVPGFEVVTLVMTILLVLYIRRK